MMVNMHLCLVDRRRHSCSLMSMIHTMLNSLATHLNHDTNPFISYYRYIDDIFIVYKGSMNVLQMFLEEINNIHDSIKFTSDMSSPFSCNVPHDVNYDCFCHTSNSIPFLDTLFTLNNGHLVTDLFRKPTDRFQYLLPSSCHPSNITRTYHILSHPELLGFARKGHHCLCA